MKKQDNNSLNFCVLKVRYEQNNFDTQVSYRNKINLWKTHMSILLHSEKVWNITVYVNFISPAFTTNDTVIVPFVVMF